VLPETANSAALTIDVSIAVSSLPSANAVWTMSVVGTRVGYRCSRFQLNDRISRRASLIGVNPFSRRSARPPVPGFAVRPGSESSCSGSFASASGVTDCKAAFANSSRLRRVERLPIARPDVFPAMSINSRLLTDGFEIYLCGVLISSLIAFTSAFHKSFDQCFLKFNIAITGG
jgi:hypothetical protein